MNIIIFTAVLYSVLSR